MEGVGTIFRALRATVKTFLVLWACGNHRRGLSGGGIGSVSSLSRTTRIPGQKWTLVGHFLLTKTCVNSPVQMMSADDPSVCPVVQNSW